MPYLLHGPWRHIWRRSPLAVLSLQVYVPLSSSCTELSSSLHLFPSKCILQLRSAGWMSFPSDSQSTSTSCGPITWHSNSTDSPAFTVTSLRGRTMARPVSTGVAGRWAEKIKKAEVKVGGSVPVVYVDWESPESNLPEYMGFARPWIMCLSWIIVLVRENGPLAKSLKSVN